MVVEGRGTGVNGDSAAPTPRPPHPTTMPPAREPTWVAATADRARATGFLIADRFFGSRRVTVGASLQRPRKVPLRIEPKTYFGERRGVEGDEGGRARAGATPAALCRSAPSVSGAPGGAALAPGDGSFASASFQGGEGANARPPPLPPPT